MTDQYKKSGPEISPDTGNATGSQEFQDGHSPSSGQDGGIDPAGQEARPANPSHPPASNGVQMTIDIFGLSSSVSSKSADLSMSLVSKLKERLEWVGSTLYQQTWNAKVTPSGRAYWAHTASALPISGNDCGGSVKGWRTPDTSQGGAVPPEKLEDWKSKGGQVRLASEALLTGWPTPRAEKHSPQQREDFSPNLATIAEMAGWATPTRNDQRQYSEESLQEMVETGNVGGHGKDLNAQAQLAGWATPRSISENMGARTGSPDRAVNHRGRLEDQVMPAGWATPSARDFKSESATEEFNQKRDEHPRGKPLSYQVGKAMSSSTVQTENTGQLNPVFVCWLQGYPEGWESYADTATP